MCKRAGKQRGRRCVTSTNKRLVVEGLRGGCNVRNGSWMIWRLDQTVESSNKTGSTNRGRGSPRADLPGASPARQQLPRPRPPRWGAPLTPLDSVRPACYARRPGSSDRCHHLHCAGPNAGRTWSCGLSVKARRWGNVYSGCQTF